MRKHRQSSWRSTVDDVLTSVAAVVAVLLVTLIVAAFVVGVVVQWVADWRKQRSRAQRREAISRMRAQVGGGRHG
jgi:peptidoglycan/LPS O-acetylase OafA/YrhL